MSLVYAGALSHAPGITGRADLCENTAKRDEFLAALDQQRQDIEDSGAEALVVVAAEHREGAGQEAGGEKCVHCLVTGFGHVFVLF